MTRLTLEIDEKTLAELRRLAERDKISISAVIERVVSDSAGTTPAEEELHPAVVRATGLFRLPQGKTDRDILTEALDENYRGVAL